MPIKYTVTYFILQVHSYTVDNGVTTQHHPANHAPATCRRADYGLSHFAVQGHMHGPACLSDFSEILASWTSAHEQRGTSCSTLTIKSFATEGRMDTISIDNQVSILQHVVIDLDRANIFVNLT